MKNFKIEQKDQEKETQDAGSIPPPRAIELDVSMDVNNGSAQKAAESKNGDDFKSGVKFTVGKKISLAMSSLIVLMVVVGLISFHGLRKTNSVWLESKAVGSALSQYAEDIQTNVYRASTAQKDYLLNYKIEGLDVAKENYISSIYDKSILKAKKDVEFIISILDKAERENSLMDKSRIEPQKMMNLIENYQLSFYSMVNYIEKQGYGDYGLTGEMRKAIHAVEKEIENLNDFKLKALMLQCRRSEKDYIIRGNEKYVDKFNKNIDLLSAEVEKKTLSDNKRNLLLDSINKYKKSFTEVVSLSQIVSRERGLSNEAALAVNLQADQLAVKGRELEAEYVGVAMAVSKPLQVSIVITLGLSILIGLGFAYFISRGITSNLKVLVQHMSGVASSGDLTQEVKKKSSDELGKLAFSFNQMRKSLYDIVSNILQASLKINSSSNEILAASNQHETTTTEQSSQMTQIQATLTQAASTATELSRTSKEVSEFAQGIEKNSQDGGEVIEETRVKMGEMKQANEAVSNKLKVLSEKIEGINKMLTIIMSVADQTNLLSLNAAIEASKAGEHGKGFSVVAEEIRRLADQTSQSSGEIANIISEIQAASSSAIMVTEKSMHEMESGGQLVGDLASRFSTIKDQVQQILPQIENVSESISELANGNNEISRSVKDMSEAVKLTAISAKQTRQSASDLTAMAQELRQGVSQFKLS